MVPGVLWYDGRVVEWSKDFHEIPALDGGVPPRPGRGRPENQRRARPGGLPATARASQWLASYGGGLLRSWNPFVSRVVAPRTTLAASHFSASAGRLTSPTT